MILLEDQKLTDPIKLVVDNDVNFNVYPININNREIGVQIINTPQFEKLLSANNKPVEGPFISSGQQKTEETTNEIPVPTEETFNTIETDIDEETIVEDSEYMPEETLEEETIEADPIIEEEPIDEPTAEEINEDPIEEEEEITENEAPDTTETLEAPKEESDDIDDDDFSWDDLDDE